MSRKESTRRLWAALAILNFVAMLYPIVNFLHSGGSHTRFLAELVLVGVFFVLGMVDTLAIAIATA